MPCLHGNISSEISTSGSSVSDTVKYFYITIKYSGGGWRLVHSSPDQGVQVQSLIRGTVLCSSARHLALTVPLSLQEYKSGTSELFGKPNKLQGSDV